MSPAAFFRQDYQRRQGQAHPPGIQLLSQPGTGLMAAVLASFAAGLLLLAANVNYSKRSGAQGIIVPSSGMAILRAPIAGKVTRAPTRINASVAQDEILFEILSDQSTGQDASTRAALEGMLTRRMATLGVEQKLQQDVLLGEQSKIGAQLASIEQQLGSLEDEQKLANRVLLAAMQRRGQFEALVKEGFASTQQLQDRDASLDQANQRLHALDRQRFELEAKLAELRREMQQSLFRSRLSGEALAREKISVEEQLLAHRASGEARVKAPMRGMLSSSLVQLNQQVAQDAPLAAILSTPFKPAAWLFVSDTHVREYKVGDSVVLRFEGSDKTRQATVQSVTTAPVTTKELMVAQSLSLPTVSYLVSVSLPPAARNGEMADSDLRAGMRINALSPGDRRPLLQWIFKPFIEVVSGLSHKT
ncbi:HlyD family efflux transporter periplasmic adaptor subunit [Kinneretia aquatilis]|nr:HlyD family efflux transporter periplasmic adaptor subunit [Paucibacter aquatile]